MPTWAQKRTQEEGMHQAEVEEEESSVGHNKQHRHKGEAVHQHDIDITSHLIACSIVCQAEPLGKSGEGSSPKVAGQASRLPTAANLPAHQARGMGWSS
jgi:hypothetical protein